ncbi:MAG: hypothetical protein RL701_8193 [Pseudomonadota bacterium]
MEKKGPKKRRLFWRWVIGSALTLIIAPVALATFARTPLMREYARQEVQRSIRRELGLVGTVDDIDVEPRTLTFVARGITLDHPEHGRFVEAELLRIRPSFWALLRWHIDLHNITIDGASVWLVVRDGKLVNGPLVKTSASSAQPSIADLPFTKVRIAHSRFHVDAGELGSGELSDISLALDSTRRKVLGIELLIPHGQIEHRAGREVLHDVEARATLTDQKLQVELLRLQTDDLTVAVEHASVQLPAAQQYQAEVELELDLASLGRLPVPGPLPAITGRTKLRGHVKNDPQHGVHADGHVELRRVTVNQFGLGELVSLDASFDKGKVQFQGAAHALRNGGSVEIAGTLGLDKHLPLDVRARVNDINFAKLMDQLSVTPNAIVEWTLAGNFELHGTLDPLLLQGPLRMPTRDFRVLRDPWHTTPQRNVISIPVGNLAGTVVVKPKGIFLTHVDLGFRYSKLHVDECLLGFDNELRLRGKAESGDLRDITPLLDFPIAGRGAFNVTIDGTFMDPKIGGHLRFSEFAFATFPFGDVESDFKLEKQVQAVRFPELLAKKGRSRYSAKNFVLDFSEQRLSVDSDLQFDHFALQDFYHVFHYENDERYTPYQALVTGGSHLRFTLGFPGDSPNGTLHAETDLTLSEAQMSGFAFASGQAIGSWHWRDHKLGYRSGALDIERFSLRKGEGTVNISGRMDYGGKLDMVVVSDRIALQDTEGMHERMPSLGGSYAVTGTIKGQAALPRMELDVAATALTYNGELLGNVRSYVRLTDQSDPFIQEALAWGPGEAPAPAMCPHARAGLARGRWPEDPPLHTAEGLMPALSAPMAFIVCGGGLNKRLAFDIAFGRTSVLPVRGELRVRDLPLATLLQRPTFAASTGALSGSLRFTDGALYTPETLAGSLQLDRVTLGQAGVMVENEGPIAAHFGQGLFAIDHAAFMGPGSEVRIEGGGDLAGGLGLSLSGSVDMSILPSFTPAVRDASGSVQLAVKVTGPMDKPLVVGQARVDAAGVKLAELPFPIDSVEGRITFSAERMLIERMDLHLLSGNIAVQGVAALAGRELGNYRLELAADHLMATPREGVEMSVGGRGDLSWKLGDRLPKLKGSLRLGRTRYTRPITVGTTLQDLAKKARVDVDTYDPELDHVALDLRVQQSEPIRVDNNLIEAEISIDDSKEPFRLLGTDQRFGVLGNMDIRHGTFRVRDRPFTITDGEISFSNPARVEPHFEMHADTVVRRNAELGQLVWRVGVHAWGAPEAFQFELTSDPQLSQDDIALLLAVGMTHAELAQVQTSSLTSTAAFEALAAMTGVDREVQRALPAIDDVHIASAYSPRTQRTEPQLHLGKRIADRVRLNASTALSQSRDFSTGVEYQINDKTSVGAIYNSKTKTSASQLGDVGVDLKWRLEFD